MLRNGVSNDSGTSLNKCSSVSQQHRSYCDARIEIVCVVHVQNCSGVDATPLGLELADDFHCANLWRTGDSSGWETCGECIEAIEPIAHTRAHRTDQVLHMGILFNGHQLIDFY